MISLFFIYIDVAIFRYRFHIIVNLSLLFRRYNDCFITRVSLFRVTFRVTFFSFIIIKFIVLKNSSAIVIFF